LRGESVQNKIFSVTLKQICDITLSPVQFVEKDDWVFLKLLKKTLEARDCNQSKRKREVAQLLTAVNVLSLPN